MKSNSNHQQSRAAQTHSTMLLMEFSRVALFSEQILHCPPSHWIKIKMNELGIPTIFFHKKVISYK